MSLKKGWASDFLRTLKAFEEEKGERLLKKTIEKTLYWRKERKESNRSRKEAREQLYFHSLGATRLRLGFLGGKKKRDRDEVSW